MQTLSRVRQFRLTWKKRHRLHNPDEGKGTLKVESSFTRMISASIQHRVRNADILNVLGCIESPEESLENLPCVPSSGSTNSVRGWNVLFNRA